MRLALFPLLCLPLVAGSLQNANDLFFNKGDAAGALKLYEQAAREAPADAATWIMLANAARFNRKCPRAAQAIERGLEIDKAICGPYRDNCMAAFKECVPSLLGENKKLPALRLAEAGIAAFPGDADIKAAYFKAVVMAGRPAQIQALSNAEQNTAQKHLLTGMLRLREGKAAEAEAAFSAAVSSEPQNYGLEGQIIEAYRMQVEKLPYPEQMSSGLQTRVVEHAHAQVAKYFAANPFSQPGTFITPLAEFCVYQEAGGRSFHYGINAHYAYDLGLCDGSSLGAPVYAVADGVVIGAVDGNPDRPAGAPVSFSAQANMLLVEHAGGVVSLYVHLRRNSFTVRLGSKVRAGDQIAEVGNSGITTGPHLHFQFQNKDGISLPVKFSGLKSCNDEGCQDTTELRTGTRYTGR